MSFILPREESPFEKILRPSTSALSSISDLVKSYRQRQSQRSFGESLAKEFGRPELKELTSVIPSEKYADLYNSLLKEQKDSAFMRSLTDQGDAGFGEEEPIGRGAPIYSASFQDRMGDEPIKRAPSPRFLSPEQEASLALTNPSQSKAYQKWKEGRVAEQAKVQGKEDLQETWNDLAKTLKGGNLGITRLSKLTSKGREDRSYFDTLAVQIESIGKDLVSKGVLSQARFNYLLKNIPSSTDTDATNRGKLRAWAKALKLDPSILTSVDRAPKKKAQIETRPTDAIGDSVSLDEGLGEQDSDLEPEIPEKSPGKELLRSPEYLAQSLLAGAKGAPRALTGLLSEGSKYLQRKGEEQRAASGKEMTESQRRFTEKVVNALGLPERILQKVGLPTIEEAEEEIRKRAGYLDEEEPSDIERGVRSAGRFIGSAVVTPGAAFGTAARAATTGLAGAGAGIAAGMGGEGGAQLLGAIGLPTLVRAFQLIKTGKIAPTTQEARQIYESAKSLGLSDAELTPMIQGEFRKKLLGAIATPTRGSARSLERSESALWSAYERIKQQAEGLAPASEDQLNNIASKTQEIVSSLKKSKMPTDDKRKAIEKIEAFQDKVLEEGFTPAEVIDTWQDINQTVNWRSFSQGKKVLGELNKTLSDFLKESSPELFRQFESVNKLWDRLQETVEAISPKAYSSLLKAGEVGGFLKGMKDFVTNGDGVLLSSMIGVKGLKALASEMLTNPRLNSNVNRLLKSINSARRPTMVQALNEFRKDLRNYPEIDEEVDWSFLDDE